jgi:CPA2 family monovalent cation:H+ antiporter-2
MVEPLLENVLILLAVGVLAVALCRQLGLSPVLGYLATGILTGPHALGLLPDSAETRFLAELGVVLLLFTIGVEFSVSRLLALRRLVFGLGGAQIGLTALVLGGALWWWRDDVAGAGALAVGVALAMSSTAIVLKQLAEQLELAAPHGRLVVAVLLFQDLAAIGLLAALPALTEADGAALGGLSGRVLVAATTLVAMIVLGRRLLPAILHWVAATRSLELFMLTTLLLALSAALLSELVGLSPALGAFMAGMLLGETPFRHQVEADIRPFRDLMLGLFFATIGMQLDLALLASELLWLLPALFGLILVKAALVAGLAAFFGQSGEIAWRGALCLAQGGELGLLLLASALERELIPAAVGQSMLALLVLSMAAAPLLVRFNGLIAARLTGRRKCEANAAPEAQLADEGAQLAGHVLICGFGDRGQNLAAVLAREGIATLALDLDPERVRQARSAGAKVAYGDCTRPGILRAAGLDRAAALAVTCRDGDRLARTLLQLQQQGDLPPVLIRTTGAEHDADLRAIGADLYPERLESSLQFTQQLLLLLGLPHSRVEAAVERVRLEHYAPLRAVFGDSGDGRGLSDGDDESGADREGPQMHAVTLQRNSPAVGKTPEQLGFASVGVELLDVRRGGIRVPGALLDTELRGGDVLVLQGPRRALEQVIARILDGP